MTGIEVAAGCVLISLANMVIHIVAACSSNNDTEALLTVTVLSGIFFLISLTVFFTLKAVL